MCGSSKITLDDAGAARYHNHMNDTDPNPEPDQPAPKPWRECLHCGAAIEETDENDDQYYCDRECAIAYLL